MSIFSKFVTTNFKVINETTLKYSHGIYQIFLKAGNQPMEFEIVEGEN